MNLQSMPQAMPQDPLAQLRDIHLPQSVSWWPPAPGWWLLAILLLLALGVTARWMWLRYQRGAYRRAGVAELEQLLANWRTSSDTGAFLQQLNALLKRVALYSFPGADVAAMNGAGWTAFLDQQWREARSKRPENLFSGGPLEYGPYVATLDDVDVQTLNQSSLLWLREHRGQRHD
jgi:hypothetical protein